MKRWRECSGSGGGRLGGVHQGDPRHAMVASEPVAVCGVDQLRLERGCDELNRVVSVAVPDLLRRDLFGHGQSVHGIEVCVDLVKEVKRRWVALLNGENDCEGYDGLLPPRERLHRVHRPASEGAELAAAKRASVRVTCVCMPARLRARMKARKPVRLCVWRSSASTPASRALPRPRQNGH